MVPRYSHPRTSKASFDYRSGSVPIVWRVEKQKRTSFAFSFFNPAESPSTGPPFFVVPAFPFFFPSRADDGRSPPPNSHRVLEHSTSPCKPKPTELPSFLKHPHPPLFFEFYLSNQLGSSHGHTWVGPPRFSRSHALERPATRRRWELQAPKYH